MFSIYSPQPYFSAASHIPQTPSPLRTSRNVNLMPPTNDLKSSPFASPAVLDENAFSPIFNQPVYFYNGKPVQTPLKQNSVTPTTSSSYASSTTKFNFEQRARSASPAAALSRHAAESKERRKSLFLDRIRAKRDDTRGDRFEEQVLRMDFVKERRKWEETMQKRAPIEVDAEDVDVEMGEQQEGMSPTDDKELEELLTYMPIDRQSERNDEEDDDEYDALFKEVLGQENTDSGMDIS